MVGKIKNISSKPISVEDLIGDPKTTEPLPVNTTSAMPAGLPKPVQSTGTPTPFVPVEGDIYISQSQIRKFQLRKGDEISGQARLPKENERYLGLLKVEKVNGITADNSTKRPYFEDLTPSY